MLQEFFIGKGLDSLISWVKKHYDYNELEKEIDEYLKGILYDEASYDMAGLGAYVKEMDEYLKGLPYDKDSYDRAGLEAYINENLLKNILPMFLLPDLKSRKALQKAIFSSAYVRARADSVKKQKCVDKVMQGVLIIVGNFLCNRHNKEEWLPFNQVVNEVHSIIKSSFEEIKEVIEDATKQIKDKLDEIHKAINYNRSFEQFINGRSLARENKSLFNYKCPSIGLYGREREFDFLDNFLDEGGDILFTAVNGPAGSGKSKLLYKYAQDFLYNPHWKVLFPDQDDFKKIMARNDSDWKSTRNVLIIIDYAGRFSPEIGRWIDTLSRSPRPPKTRIILLEREGFAKNEGMQEKSLMYPLWYERLLGDKKDDIIQFQHMNENSTFLELEELSEEALGEIAKDYARAKDRTLSLDDVNSLVQYCKDVEEKNKARSTEARPLILLFVVDAHLRGDDYKKWGIEKLIAPIIDKYKKDWKEKLCKNDEEVFQALEKLYVYATGTGGWSLESDLPKCFNLAKIKDEFNRPSKLKEIFRSLNERSDIGNTLYPFEPDLIGEFFVLDYLEDCHTDKRIEMVLALSSKEEYFNFLLRCIEDYSEADRFSKLFQDGLKQLVPVSMIEKYPYKYSVLLADLAIAQKREEAQAITVEQLRILSERYADNQEIVLVYAKCLRNLTIVQESEEARAITVEKLRLLSERYADNQEIVLRYAMGLVNLTAAQESEESRAITVEQLGLLSERYVDNEEIVLMYANGLFNLTIAQKREEAKAITVEQLRLLSESYADNQEIVLNYAKCLYNLTAVQKSEEARAITVEQLELLSERYADNEEIVLMYTMGLVNLIVAQEREEARAITVEKLRLLSENYADNQEIVLVYAMGLFRLIVVQKREEALATTVKQLQELAEDYADNQEIVLEYAKGLFNLTFVQEREEARETTVKQLQKLAEGYADNQEIMLMYAKGLFNFTIVQEREEARATTVKKLRLLVERYCYADNQAIMPGWIEFKEHFERSFGKP